MRRLRLPVFALATILAIAACGKRDPVAPEANAAAALPTVNKPTPDPTGGPPPNAAPQQQPLSPGAAIPQALQGRWALTPADCTTTRGDAKGLLIIGSNELRFYESRAVPAAEIQTDLDSISGKFDFTGEGQSWTKYQSFKLDDRKLVRTERNPTASFTYARC
jgi:predicted small lipoprotein YifL